MNESAESVRPVPRLAEGAESFGSAEGLIGGADFASKELRRALDELYGALMYHDGPHSDGVYELSEAVEDSAFTCLSLSDLEKRLIKAARKLAVMAHDRVLNVTSDGEMVGRKRGWPFIKDVEGNNTEEYGNEYLSFIEAIKMLLVGSGKVILTDESVESVLARHELERSQDPVYRYLTDFVEDAIRATYPTIAPTDYPEGTDYTVTHKGETVQVTDYLTKNDKTGAWQGLKADQPYLLKGDSGVAPGLGGLMVGIGDLMASGRSDPDKFFESGNEEMFEISEQVLAILHKDINEIAAADISYVADKIRMWHKTQVGFVLWQKLRFEEILKTHPVFSPAGGFSAAERTALEISLRSKFDRFDENIVAAAAQADKSEVVLGEIADGGEKNVRDAFFKLKTFITTDMGISSDRLSAYYQHLQTEREHGRI